MTRTVIWQQISLNIAILLALAIYGCKSGMALEKSTNENKKLREELAQARADIKDHEQLNEELKNTKLQLRKTEDALSNLYIQLKSDSVAIQKNDKEIYRESKSTAESNRLINSLTSELNTIKEELAQCRKEYLSISDKQNNALFTIKQLNNELSSKNNSIAELNSETEKLKFQLSENSAIPQTEEKLNACKNELIRLQSKARELEEEKKKLFDELEAVKQLNLSEQNNELIAQLQLEIKSKNDKFLLLQRNIDSLNIENNKSKIAFDESILIKSKLQDVEKSKEELLKDNESLKNQINSNALLIDHLKNDIGSYKEKIETLEQNFYKQKAINDKNVMDSLRKIALREYFVKLNKAIDSIQKQHNLVKTNLDNVNDKLQKKIDNFENNIKVKESEIQTLNSKLKNYVISDSINQAIIKKQSPIIKNDRIELRDEAAEKNKNNKNDVKIFGTATIKKINEINKKHSNRFNSIANNDGILIIFPHEVLFDSKNIALNQGGSEILLDVIEAFRNEKDLIININSTLNSEKSKLELKEINILRTSTISKLFLAMGIKAERISFGIDRKSTYQSNSNEEQFIGISFTR